MGKKTQRPSVRINSYDEARRIVNGYEETRTYLTSLIENRIPNGELVVDCSDFANLKYYGRVIHGVAERMLESRISQNTKKAILKSIDALNNSKSSSQRELLHERICIQLEGCKVPDDHSLVKKYKKARNS